MSEAAAKSDPFRIRAHVPDFEAISAGYSRSSEEVRTRLRHQLNLAYGDGPAERLDLFFPRHLATPAPIHMFIHGGYWRANRKEDYALVAEPITAAGAVAAVVEYPLMPAARLRDLVAAVRCAARWLVDHAESFGGDPTAFSASGHSAGAHLASFLAAKGPGEPGADELPVKTLLLVSGIYDLRPIPGSFLQPEITLTAEEIAAWSPVDAEPQPRVQRTLLVGAAETAPFHEQAAALGRKLGTMPITLPGLDHMTIQRDLGQAGTEAARLLAETVVRSRLVRD